MQASPTTNSSRSIGVAVLLLAGLTFAYGLWIALGSHTGFPTTAQYGSRMPYLADMPLGEDAFYMLHVAWNLASGHGPVCNEGSIVTGIQPLATLVYAGVAWANLHLGGDPWTFLRLVLILNVLLLLAFAECVGRIAAAVSAQNRATACRLGILFTALSFTVFRHFTYGLETGMYLTAFAATILFTLRRIPFGSPRDVVVLGLLVGLCGWCRIDFGLCFAIFSIFIILFNRVK